MTLHCRLAAKYFAHSGLQSSSLLLQPWQCFCCYDYISYMPQLTKCGKAKWKKLEAALEAISLMGYVK